MQCGTKKWQDNGFLLDLWQPTTGCQNCGQCSSGDLVVRRCLGFSHSFMENGVTNPCSAIRILERKNHLHEADGGLDSDKSSSKGGVYARRREKITSSNFKSHGRWWEDGERRQTRGAVCRVFKSWAIERLNQDGSTRLIKPQCVWEDNQIESIALRVLGHIIKGLRKGPWAHDQSFMRRPGCYRDSLFMRPKCLRPRISDRPPYISLNFLMGLLPLSPILRGLISQFSPWIIMQP